jgi:hypothetical protein
MKRQCDWPNCTATTHQWLDDGWCSYADAVLPDMPEDGYLCPRHERAYEALVLNEQPPTPAEH